MLDGAHAAFDRAPDRARRVGVRHHVGLGRLGFLDDRAHLLEGILGESDRVGRRGDAARGHDLDLGGALAHLVAHGAAHLGDAVGDAAECAAEQRTADARLDHLGQRAEIGMAAGLAEGAPGMEDTRAIKEALLDGLR